MTTITKGLYEVLVSDRLTLEQKIQSVEAFALPIHHLDGEHEGMIEAPAIAEEDASLIVEALRDGRVVW